MTAAISGNADAPAALSIAESYARGANDCGASYDALDADPRVICSQRTYTGDNGAFVTISLLSSDVVGDNRISASICNKAGARVAYWDAKPLAYRLPLNAGAPGNDPYVQEYSAARRRAAHFSWSILRRNHAGAAQRDGLSGKNTDAPAPPRRSRD